MHSGKWGSKWGRRLHAQGIGTQVCCTVTVASLSVSNMILAGVCAGL